jgi:SAM-dependent methyltransferase
MDRKKEWFNDAEFWERFAPIMFDAARWAEVPAVAEGLTSLASLDLYASEYQAAGILASRPSPSACCLEQCCGFGRISLEMARRGFAVTGVDITKSYLEAAVSDAVHEQLAVEFLEEDVRDFRRENTFDLVYSVYNSFGYFSASADDALAVKNAFDSLKPGGAYIVETMGKEIAVRDFIQAEWFERAGYYVLTSYEAVDSWAALKNRWIIIGQGGKKDTRRGEMLEKTFTQRLYAADSLRSLLLEAGFALVETYGGWESQPYDEQARTLVVCGRKA